MGIMLAQQDVQDMLGILQFDWLMQQEVLEVSESLSAVMWCAQQEVQDVLKVLTLLRSDWLMRQDVLKVLKSQSANEC